jgi:hypothetical protein
MSFGGTAPPVIRHLLLCQHIGYDTNNPAAPYSLHGLVTALQPEPGDQYPLLLPELWVFFQASGDSGDCQLWIDLVPVDQDGADAGEETTYGPCILIIHEGVHIESRGWKLLNLPFAAPGLYEVRLWCGSDMIAREQLLLTEA